jgi:hypothetical protein
MSIVFKQATCVGTQVVRISLGQSSETRWELKSLSVQCKTTFTAAVTFTLKKLMHEGAVYDHEFHSTALGVGAGILQQFFYSIDNPMIFTGKDAVQLTNANASAALEWSYSAVLREI